MQFDKAGALHFIFFLCTCTYAFVIPASPFDYWFLIIEYTIYFFWTIFHGQCPLSYYYRKKYHPSSRSIDSTDMINLFGPKHATLVHRICYALLLLMYVTFGIVFQRTNIDVLFALWPFPTYYVLSYLRDPYVNALFALVFLYYIMYIYCKWRAAQQQAN